MSLYGVIGYHVTLSEGHMISCGKLDLFVTKLFIPYKGWLFPEILGKYSRIIQSEEID